MDGVRRQALHTQACLFGWVQARQRGVGVADCDAIAIAAADAVIDQLEEWDAQHRRAVAAIDPSPSPFRAF